MPSPPPPRSPDPLPGFDAPDLRYREEDGGAWPFHVWRFAEPHLMISSAPVGGGIGERDWIVNAQVRSGYARHDLDAHIAALAALAALPPGRGVGLLTAADVAGAIPGADGDVTALATVGIRVPTWAAAPDRSRDPTITADAARALTRRPGTINIVACVPVALSDAALVNLVATVTEAKTQALLEAGIAGTGTATDAVCIVCPRPGGAAVEPFGGPRSRWGAAAARATHASVRAGIDGSLRIIGAAADDDLDDLDVDGSDSAAGPLGPDHAPQADLGQRPDLDAAR